MFWILFYGIICILGIIAVIKHLKNKQSGGGMVDAKKEINFVSKWKHMMVH